MDLTQSSIDLTGINNTGAYTGTINSGISDDTITLSSYPWPNTVTAGGLSFSNANIGAVGSITGGPYTVTAGAFPNVAVSGGFTVGTGWNGTTGNTPWLSQTSASTKINLEGENADIVVNGHSLVDAINSIKDRLNCLQINPKLEAEWDELKALGDQYRKLEKHILDKQATWDRLKAMPPPEIE